MINIAISGSSGRMGSTLINSVLERDGFKLTAAIDHPKSSILGNDAAQMMGLDACGVFVSHGIEDKQFDVLIDFTRPKATLGYLDWCIDHNKSLVIGTTGFDSSQLKTLEKTAESIAIVIAPNMSVGVNLSFKLMEMAARAVGSEADIEIIEAHHKHKVDAPSGTAIAMGEIIANVLGITLQENGVFTRHGHTGARKANQIGFSAIRAGDIIGDHTALFALDGERIEITHKASSRAIYANGALRAAQWIVSKNSPGLYNMQNVLGLG